MSRKLQLNHNSPETFSTSRLADFSGEIAFLAVHILYWTLQHLLQRKTWCIGFAGECMEPQELQENRWKIGLVSLLCLATSLGIYLVEPERTAVLAAFLRVGTLLGAFWFAIPLLIRKPRFLRWFPWYLLLGLLVLIVFFRYLVFLLPAYIALALFAMFSQAKRPKVSNAQDTSTNTSSKNR